jgi:hypothetical protein
MSSIIQNTVPTFCVENEGKQPMNENEAIVFGDWLHDNYYAVQGGWWQYIPVKFGDPYTTAQLYLIFKPIYDEQRGNIG